MATRPTPLGVGCLVVALVLVAGAAVAGLTALRDRGATPPVPGQQRCVATSGDRSVALDLEQARLTSIIVGLSVRRRLAPRAASIAMATVYQETGIRNLDYGDRDSVGLFQQRPSQGWGSLQQVRDARYATRAFFEALEQVEGYQQMRVHVAAQRVQRSADGSAYAQHTDSARVLSAALTGRRAAVFSCEVDTPPESAEAPGRTGLTPTAEALRRDVASSVGPLPVGGFDPDGVTSGHSSDSAHYDGRAIDYFFRPVTEANTRRGWALASYLVANADRLEIATVIFSDSIWTARRSSEGWRAYDPGTLDGGEGDEIRRHLDHVHVDVA